MGMRQEKSVAELKAMSQFMLIFQLPLIIQVKLELRQRK